MYDFPYSHPAYLPYLERSLQERVEAQSRAAYLAVVGIESAASFIGHAVTAGLRRAARNYRRARSRRLTIQALSRLDDRLLRDVGIQPGSIELLAAEMAELPSRRRSETAAARNDLAPALPLLRLDLGCPELKHAA